VLGIPVTHSTGGNSPKKGVRSAVVAECTACGTLSPRPRFAKGTFSSMANWVSWIPATTLATRWHTQHNTERAHSVPAWHATAHSDTSLSLNVRPFIRRHSASPERYARCWWRSLNPPRHSRPEPRRCAAALGDLRSPRSLVHSGQRHMLFSGMLLHLPRALRIKAAMQNTVLRSMRADHRSRCAHEGRACPSVAPSAATLGPRHGRAIPLVRATCVDFAEPPWRSPVEPKSLTRLREQHAQYCSAVPPHPV
jgi:hypothetical protein